MIGLSFVDELAAAITKIRQLQPMAVWHGSRTKLQESTSRLPSGDHAPEEQAQSESFVA
jgi:hypothetical protein